jgi:hypothetical protein
LRSGHPTASPGSALDGPGLKRHLNVLSGLDEESWYLCNLPDGVSVDNVVLQWVPAHPSTAEQTSRSLPAGHAFGRITFRVAGSTTTLMYWSGLLAGPRMTDASCAGSNSAP